MVLFRMRDNGATVAPRCAGAAAPGVPPVRRSLPEHPRNTIYACLVYIRWIGTRRVTLAAACRMHLGKHQARRRRDAVQWESVSCSRPLFRMSAVAALHRRRAAASGAAPCRPRAHRRRLHAAACTRPPARGPARPPPSVAGPAPAMRCTSALRAHGLPLHALGECGARWPPRQRYAGRLGASAAPPVTISGRRCRARSPLFRGRPGIL